MLGGALGGMDVDVDTLPEMVEVELLLKFLLPGHDSINALGPFGGDLCIGFGATVRVETRKGRCQWHRGNIHRMRSRTGFISSERSEHRDRGRNRL